MAKKKPSKSKAKARKPTGRAVSGTTAGIDYGNTLRFLFAGVTDAGFRDAVGSGNETKVRDALSSVSISFPDSADFDVLVAICLNITELDGAWNLFDDLRGALQGSGGGGAT